MADRGLSVICEFTRSDVPAAHVLDPPSIQVAGDLAVRVVRDSYADLRNVLVETVFAPNFEFPTCITDLLMRLHALACSSNLELIAWATLSRTAQTESTAPSK